MLLQCLSPLSGSNGGQLQNHVLSELTQNFIVLFREVFSLSTKSTNHNEFSPSEYYMDKRICDISTLFTNLFCQIIKWCPNKHL